LLPATAAHHQHFHMNLELSNVEVPKV
jgi:hypothetical protein